MDLEPLNKGFKIARKRKKFLLLGAIAVTSYGAYKVYHSPSAVKKRNRLLNFFSALAYVVEAISDSAEAAGIVGRDLKQFLESDSDEIPNSLKQISKIANSSEFSLSIVRVTEAFTSGILRGYRSEATEHGGDERNEADSGLYDGFMARLFSPAGSGFASVVVGSFARNLVLAFYSDENSDHGSNSGRDLAENSQSGWLNALCSNEKCREVIGDCIQLFVSNAVAVYLEKTMNINTYDEFFAGLTNPKHEDKVRDVVVSVCNGAVETLIKTSHQVLTSSNSSTSDPQISGLVLAGSSSQGNSNPSANCHPGTDGSQTPVMVGQKGFLGEDFLDKLKQAIPFEQKKDPGWVSRVSSTLAVPSNRRFVLDVTGRITFETVRSFLQFLLEKVVNCLKRSFNAVHHAVVDRGLEVLRYVSAKSSVVGAICISLCLHVVSGGTARVLMPA